MVESIESEKRKDYAGAIALFDNFLKSASSQLHIDIAKNELARLRRMLET
jgi:hypothetical protein